MIITSVLLEMEAGESAQGEGDVRTEAEFGGSGQPRPKEWGNLKTLEEQRADSSQDPPERTSTALTLNLGPRRLISNFWPSAL